MKAVILVGGKGTRLRPLTCKTPKAAIPILNRPALEHMLRYLEGHGIHDVILATGHLADSIDGILKSIQIDIRTLPVLETMPLGTAGAVKNASRYLDDAFVVLNGDIVTGIDLSEMARLHRQVRPRVTMALTPVDNPTMYGVVETTDCGLVKKFVEKPGWDRVTTNLINAGIYIIEPAVLDYVAESTMVMFEDYVFPRLLEQGEPVLAYPSDAYWIDVGTPEKYLKVNQDLLGQTQTGAVVQGEAVIDPGARLEGPVLIGPECVIAAGAHIRGPSVIGPQCRIAAGAAIEASVLWDNVTIGERSKVKTSIIASNCRVEEDCYLEQCVLGRGVTIGRGNSLDWGARIWPDSLVGCAPPASSH
ncbi:MAG: NDP-sugar synthase [Chloroflexi bacterium]|nr:NDP-sugar synthase [Chloroflexota bacterium]